MHAKKLHLFTLIFSIANWGRGSFGLAKLTTFRIARVR